MAFSLAGCSTGIKLDVAPYLTVEQAKKSLVVERSQAFKDPESIREAKIGTTYTCGEQAVCACIEVNAKNSFGGYVGLKKYVAVWKYGKFRDLDPPRTYDLCDNFTPFPELNGKQ